MKKNLIRLFAMTALWATAAQAAPIGNTFTYQGELNNGTAQVTGLYDFSFTVWDAASGGAQIGGVLTPTGVPVTNGLFTVVLDFGTGVFDGNARWLSISVKTNGGGSYTSLTPRQALTASPYALYAPNAGAAATAVTAGSAATAGSATTAATAGTATTANGVANGIVVKSLNGLKDDVVLASGTNVTLTANGQTLTVASPNDWHLAGNSGVTGSFLGTTDSNPLHLKVNSVLGFRLEPSAVAVNVIGGGADNTITSYGSFIGAGGNNQIQNGAYLSAIGGGLGNVIQSNSYYSVVAGGAGNEIRGGNGSGALAGSIGGGFQNIIEPFGYDATIAGGAYNRVQYDSDYGTIGGGTQNLIGTNADGSIIAGGSGNIISNGASYATIPGGTLNAVGAAYGFAAGYQARANHTGSFVWSDASGAAFGSTANNQFLIRAAGNVGINKNNPATALDVNGVVTAAGFIGDGSGLTGLSGIGNSSLTLDSASLYKVSGGRMGVNGARIYLPSVSAIDTSNFTGLGLQYNSAYGEGAIMSSYDDGFSSLSFYTKPGAGSAVTKQVIIDRYGGFAIDQANSNTGKLDHASANGTGLTFGTGSGEGIASKRNAGGNQYGLDFYTGYSPRMSIDNVGRVGIGTTAPSDSTLDVRGDIRISDCQLLLRAGTDRHHGLVYKSSVNGISVDGPFLFGWYGGAVGTSGPDTVTLKWDYSGNVWISNNCSVASLTVRGGADVAEPFPVTGGEVEPGTVMVIDENHPGQLIPSSQGYDTRVAGIVSGAGGVRPGLELHQEGILEHGQKIALTGRVYVRADTTTGPIKPGDLLTSSDIPGCAMKAYDSSRAQGAIIGKAMTGLKEGKGLVLVLVSLQ